MAATSVIPSNHVGHEKHGNHRRHQGGSNRDYGEADLPRARQRRVPGLRTSLHQAHDILDHDDGIIDNEADRDSKRHQGQIIEAVAKPIHHRQGCGKRDGDCHRGNDRGAGATEKQRDNQHHQPDCHHDSQLHICDGGTDQLGAVEDDVHLDRWWHPVLELRQQRLHSIDGGDDIGIRPLVHTNNDTGFSVEPAGETRVDHAVGHLGDVTQQYRRAMTPGHNDRTIVSRLEQLVVGRNGPGLAVEMKRTLRHVECRIADRCTDLLERDAHGARGQPGSERRLVVHH